MREEPPPHFKSVGRPDAKSRLATFTAWALVIIAAVFALTGAYFLGVNNATVTEVEILIPTPAPAVVQVVGEVRSPGVYELASDERVFAAIEAAGGMTDTADVVSLNLAAVVEDGSRIFVPSVPPTLEPAVENADAVGERGAETPAASLRDAAPISDQFGDKIDLNAATVEQLKSLPGIGDTRARQIIALRESVGRFSVLEQLLEINGIGEKTLESIRPLVVLR